MVTGPAPDIRKPSGYWLDVIDGHHVPEHDPVQVLHEEEGFVALLHAERVHVVEREQIRATVLWRSALATASTAAMSLPPPSRFTLGPAGKRCEACKGSGREPQE